MIYDCLPKFIVVVDLMRFGGGPFLFDLRVFVAVFVDFVVPVVMMRVSMVFVIVLY